MHLLTISKKKTLFFSCHAFLAIKNIQKHTECVNSMHDQIFTFVCYASLQYILKHDCSVT